MGVFLRFVKWLTDSRPFFFFFYLLQLEERYAEAFDAEANGRNKLIETAQNVEEMRMRVSKFFLV